MQKKVFPIDSKLILRILLVVTLTVAPFMIEPTILPKMTVLTGALLFILIKDIYFSNQYDFIDYSFLTILLIYFFVNFIGQNIYHEIPTSQILMGTQGRNLGLITYMLFGFIFYLSTLLPSSDNPKLTIEILFKLGIFFTAYGSIQSFSMEPISYFVDWYNPNREVVLTFGNTNFASSFLAFLFSATLGVVLSQKFSKNLRLLAFVNAIWISILVFTMKDFQGKILILFVLCMFLAKRIKTIFVAKSYQIVISVFLMTTVSILSIVFLQYKEIEGIFKSNLVSLVDRIFHWQAAMRMIRDNLLFGVGIDDFGNWYRVYRSEEAIAFRGNAATGTDNAHNVVLQMFSTGGLFLGLPYVILLLYITYKCLRFKSDRSNVYIDYSIKICWFVFILQSLISPDHIAFSIWGFFIGGIFLSLNRKNQLLDNKFQKKLNNENSSFNIIRYIVKNVYIFIFVICSIITVQLTSQSIALNSSLNRLKNAANFQEQELSLGEVTQIAINSIDVGNICRTIEIERVILTQENERIVLESIRKLSEYVILKAPRNICGWQGMVNYYLATNEVEKAKAYLDKLISLDPLNNELNVIRFGLEDG